MMISIEELHMHTNIYFQVTQDLDLYIVDVNDNSPIFKNEPYKWELKEVDYFICLFNITISISAAK